MLNPILRKNLSRELQWNEMDSNFEKTAILLNQEKLKENFITYIDNVKNDCLYWDTNQEKFRSGTIEEASTSIELSNTSTVGDEYISTLGPLKASIDQEIYYTQYSFKTNRLEGALLSGFSFPNLFQNLADENPASLTSVNVTLENPTYIGRYISFTERKFIPNSGLPSSVSVVSVSTGRFNRKSFAVLLKGTVPALKIRLQNTGYANEWIEINFNFSTGLSFNSSVGNNSEILEIFIDPAYTDREYYRVCIFLRLTNLIDIDNSTITASFSPINLDGSPWNGDNDKFFSIIAPTLRQSNYIFPVCSELTTEESTSLTRGSLYMYYIETSSYALRNQGSFYFDIDIVKNFKRFNEYSLVVEESAELFNLYDDSFSQAIIIELTTTGVRLVISPDGSRFVEEIISGVNFNYTGKIRCAIVFDNKVVKIFINGSLFFAKDLNLIEDWTFTESMNNLYVVSGSLSWGKYIAQSDYSFTDTEAITLTTIV